MDDSATINPAALTGSPANIQSGHLAQPNSRGIKRSRSPDVYNNQDLERESATPRDDIKTSKRTKVKQEGLGQAPGKSGASTMSHHPSQTPQPKAQSLPQQSPTQASPPRTIKQPVVKALPTVRDHTTDQLNPEGDEYIPRETDPDGETKVSADGEAQGGRKYKCRVFQVPNRGKKLFMLATECARVLSYRDSYLLFNKNRSLYKIIANQAEKDNLIQQEILPYSYRSRQIAIVTARSMFRQFGSRLIVDGRRVRDDYWEAKARKQGFTEEDAAGEKRPGLTKSRQEAAEQANALTSLPQGEIIYSNSGHGFEGQPPGLSHSPLAPLPMINIPAEDLRPSMVGNYARPRQEIAGQGYVDRIQPSNPSEMLSQTASAAEFNKQVKDGRKHREGWLNEHWNRPHIQPTHEPAPGQNDMSTIAPQTLQSPQIGTGIGQSRTQQEQLPHPGTHYTPQPYSPYPPQQNPITSPIQNMHRAAPNTHIHPNSPSMNMSAGHRQTPSYGAYPQGQMWQPQPQASPLPQSHHMSSYGQQQQQQHPSQTPAQHHGQMPPPQLQQPGMAYGQMGQMGQGGYPGINRGMYQQSPGPQYNMVPQSGAGAQPGMQGWSAPGGNSGNMPQNYGYQ